MTEAVMTKDQSSIQTIATSPKQYNIKETFNVPFGGNVLGYEEHPLAPKRKNHSWDVDLFLDMLVFMNSDKRAAKLTGHTGTGKTSSVLDFHAGLRRPLLTVSGSANMTESELFGDFVFNEDRSMRFQLGPILLAALNGYSVIYNEYNLGPSGVNSKLNDLLDGVPYLVPQTGQIINVHPNFKLFATQNPSTSSCYLDRFDQDAANEMRFFHMKANYLNSEVEVAALLQHAQMKGLPAAHAEQTCKLMVDVANKVRKSFIAEELTSVISTRTLLDWLEFSMLFGAIEARGISKIHYALEKVFTDAPSVTDVDRITVHETVTAVFGTKRDLTDKS